MSLQNGPPSIASADASQCLDPTNKFMFLNVLSKTYITTCIDNSKRLQEQKKQKYVIDGNNIDDRDLPDQIKKASIDYVRT